MHIQAVKKEPVHSLSIVWECSNRDPCLRFVVSIVETLFGMLLGACSVGFFQQLPRFHWLHCFCPLYRVLDVIFTGEAVYLQGCRIRSNMTGF